MLGALLLAALLPQQYSSPPSGDTTGYWQQRADYAVTARLDERRGVLTAAGTLTYANHSPDTLRELWLHQHLNAFRPGSRWSQADEREGRVRFQRLGDPDHAYERFTAAPTVDGAPVTPEYPGAPDSTVVRLRLPRPLPPGGTVVVGLAWEARPSTVPRRQARRGRSYDFAQWYPKVAVYDRRGWETNPLVPQGEFYGEFGAFDVTLQVAEDQVIGATGVPVDGDPGWRRALRWGEVPRTRAYGTPPRGTPPAPPGMKAVRFVARGVHHFGFSLSPDYRYEGGTYVRVARPAPGALAFAPFDTVEVHVLYRPGDEREWGGGRVVERTRNTLAWLERVYGAYGYPQMTVLHRIESGGTEFPMVQMNGSPSQGLNLHEGGHIYSYGLLASNEWQSGWMDEGLTSYQTSWAQGLTRHDRARRRLGLPLPPLAAGPAAPARPTGFLAGYRARALRPAAEERTAIEQHRLALTRVAEPVGTRADSFAEFAVYNQMVYTRAEMMFGALRDVLGEPAFGAFLRDYYARWAFRHVDELAMRASAERACGCALDWFFRQWVHDVGAIDYALSRATVERRGDGWVTTARVRRRGEYRHPVAVGARVGGAWTLVKIDPALDDQTVTVATSGPPDEVRLDPLRTTEDWYRPNDVAGGAPWLLDSRRATWRLDLPFLDQAHGERYVVGVLPFAWYSRPGSTTPAVRARWSYQGWADQGELGLALATRTPREAEGPSRVQGWLTFAAPRWNGRVRPGVSGGLWALDGVGRARFVAGRDASRYRFAPRQVRGERWWGADAIVPYSHAWQDTLRWSRRASAELFVGTSGLVTRPDTMRRAWRFDAAVGGSWPGSAPAGDAGAGLYGRAAFEGRASRRMAGGRLLTQGRVFAGGTHARATPAERRVHLSSQSPAETFGNHFLRPAGAPLAPGDPADGARRLGDHYLPLGGAGLRGYHQLVSADAVASANGELALALLRVGPPARPLRLEATAFGDVGWADGVALSTLGRLPDDGRGQWLADAGVGLALRGWVLDREVRLRLDLPLLVRHPALAVGARAGDGRAAARAAFSLDDLW